MKRHVNLFWGIVIGFIPLVVIYVFSQYILKMTNLKEVMWIIIGFTSVGFIWFFIFLNSMKNSFNQNINILAHILDRQMDMSEFTTTQMFGLISKQEPKKEIIETTKQFVEIMRKNVRQEFEKFQKKMENNPLTQVEFIRLKSYFNVAGEGKQFSIKEARDFDKLAKMFYEDSKREPSFGIGTILLSALAGFILGSLLSKKK